MILPQCVIAFLCILFGIAAISLPLKIFFTPLTGPINFIGFWTPNVATFLIVIGLLFGLLLFYLLPKNKIRTDKYSYVGGERLPDQEKVPSTSFYDTISDISVLNVLYSWAKKQFFDVYEISRKIVFFIIEELKKLHTGVLLRYVVWVVVGLVIVIFVIVR